MASWHGYGLALVAATLWATLGIFGKFLYRYPVDPLTVVALRAIIATLILGGILAVFRPAWLRVAPRDLPFFVVFGAVGLGLSSACFFMAFKWTTVTTAIVIVYTYPVLVVIGAALFFGERVDWPKLLALPLTIAGCFLVAQAYDPSALRLNLPGVAFSLAAALGTAGYSLLGKRGVNHYPGPTVTLYAFIFGALALIPLRGGALAAALSYPWPAWLLILALALGPTLLAYSLFNLALARIEVSRASIIDTLEPVLALGMAYGLLGERMNRPQALGAALVLVGVLVVQVAALRQRAPG